MSNETTGRNYWVRIHRQYSDRDIVFGPWDSELQAEHQLGVNLDIDLQCHTDCLDAWVTTDTEGAEIAIASEDLEEWAVTEVHTVSVLNPQVRLTVAKGAEKFTVWADWELDDRYKISLEVLASGTTYDMIPDHLSEATDVICEAIEDAATQLDARYAKLMAEIGA